MPARNRRSDVLDHCRRRDPAARRASPRRCSSAATARCSEARSPGPKRRPARSCTSPVLLPGVAEDGEGPVQGSARHGLARGHPRSSRRRGCRSAWSSRRWARKAWRSACPRAASARTIVRDMIKHLCSSVSYGGAASLGELRSLFWADPDKFLIRQSPSARRESYERMTVTARDASRRLRQHAVPGAADVLQRFFKTGPASTARATASSASPCDPPLCRECRGMAIDEVERLLQSKIHEERLLALLILVDAFAAADAAGGGGSTTSTWGTRPSSTTGISSTPRRRRSSAPGCVVAQGAARQAGALGVVVGTAHRHDRDLRRDSPRRAR